MRKLMNWMKNEESGQGMVEYALIIALVSIVAIAILFTLGGTIEGIFQDADDALKSR